MRIPRWLMKGLTCSVLAFVLSGCYPIPVGSKRPSYLADSEKLDSLVGKHKSVIIQSLGKPDDVLVGKTSSFFIYGGYGTEYLAYILVWVPLAGDSVPDARLFCVLLEFDEEDIFRRYTFKEHSRTWTDKNISDCASTFFAQEELESFIRSDDEVDAFIKKKKIDATKHDHQWELSKRKELRSKYKELCKAAEQGDYRAQWELGYLHANGLYGVRKDLVLSAMWYGRVESAGHHTGGLDTIREQLTPEQLADVERLSDEWQPGQCEQELFEIGSRNTQ